MATTSTARVLVRTSFFAVIALVVELGACGSLAVLERRGVRYQPILADRLSAENRLAIDDFLGGRDSAFQLDAVLGWTLRPGFRSPTLTVDAEGRRRSPDRLPLAGDDPTAVARLAAFGDSFTFGGDVVDRDSYPEALARLDRAIDVANYGVPAYGLDQAFLHYLQERGSARPQVVVIGYLSENICRGVSVFRPFYNPRTVFPLAKPRYVVGQRDSAPTLLDNPLPTPESYRRLLANPSETLAELGRHDSHYKNRPHASPWDRSAAVRLVKLAATEFDALSRGDCYGDDEALSLTVGLFRLFYETVLEDGAQPVILVFPTHADAAAWRRDRRKSYLPLLNLLDDQRLRIVDAMDVLDEGGRSLSIDEFVPAHLTPLGNTLVAELLRQRLQAFGLIPSRAPSGALPESTGPRRK